MLTSRRNPLVQDIRRIAKCKGDRYLIEGPLLIEEAIKRGVALQHVLVSERLLRNERFSRILAPGVVPITVSDEVLEYLADARTPQGTVAVVCRQPDSSLESLELEPNSLVLVLDGVSDPGNLGTLLRSAEAFGVAAVLAVEGGAHPYAPKTVRASAGAVLSLPIRFDLGSAEVSNFLARRAIPLVAADAHRGVPAAAIEWRKGAALVVGSEAHGVSPSLGVGRHVRILLAPGVESLNVAVAAGILLQRAFEARTEGR